MVIRWGIVGCGNVSEQFATCLEPLEKAELVAVASQSPGKAEQFAGKFGNSKAYTSYQDLVKDTQVDVVYIGTTHNFHHEHAILALNNGKHVLCEKPVSLNARLAQEMFDLAGNKNLFLMEAVWTRFHPATLKMVELVKAGTIGEIFTVQADFSIIRAFDPKHRLYDPELGGGALLDLGIYPLTFAHLVYEEFPKSFKTSAVLGKSGVDETSAYLLEYEGGKTAVLSSSCRSSSPHLGLVIGSKGYMSVPDFFHPQELFIRSLDCDEQHLKLPYDLLGYGPEAEEVMRCLEAGLLESPLIPWATSIEMMKLMDSFRTEWGMKYPNE